MRIRSLRVVLRATSFAIILLSGPAFSSEVLEHPLGNSFTKDTALRFNSRIDLRSSETGTFMSLFCEHYVGPGCKKMEVIWCEPHWNSMPFAHYPVSLSVYSSDTEFIVSNDVMDREWKANKPIPVRSDFPYAGENYPIRDIPHAEGEAERHRIYIKDIADRANQPSESVDININDPQRELGPISARIANNRIHNLLIHNRDGQLNKTIQYIYDPTGKLSSTETWLGELQIPATFGNDGPILTVNGISQRIERTELVRREGTRVANVSYTEVPLGDRLVRLPRLITVINSKSRTMLRKAELSNYRLDGSGGPSPQHDFGYSEAERRWRTLEIDYWLKPRGEIPDTVLLELEDLRSLFISQSTQNSSNAGLYLRNLHMASIVALMTDDTDGFQNLTHSRYDFFQNSGLVDTLLADGREFLYLACRWNKPWATEWFISYWLDAVENADIEHIIAFAYDSVLAQRAWLALELVELKTEQATLTLEEIVQLTFLGLVCLDIVMETPPSAELDKEGRYVPLDFWTDDQKDKWTSWRHEMISKGNEALSSLGNVPSSLEISEKFLRARAKEN